MSKFTDASLVVVPSLHKAGKLYAVKPGTGLADFTVTRSTVKWVLGPNGVLRSVPANTPALEYNTDRTFRGLLVEPASTNLCLQSEDLGTTWVNTNTTETTNAISAPNGTTTADLLIPNNGTVLSNLPRITQTINKAASSITYTMSVWAKNGGFNRAQIRFRDNSVNANLARVTVNLDTGIAESPIIGGTFTSASATASAFPNGWYRISVTATTSTETTLELALGVLDSVATTGDGVNGIYFWGAQFESGPVATSYIPTVASTFNRTADSIVRTSASDLIGQTSGTMYVEVEVPNFTTSIGRRVLQLSDGTTSNRISLNTLSGGNRVYQLFVVNGGVNTVDIQQISGAVNISKVAIGYATNDYVLYVNGNSIGTDTLSNVPATSRIDIGNLLSGNDNMIGWIRSVVISSERFPNAELATLTTL